MQIVVRRVAWWKERSFLYTEVFGKDTDYIYKSKNKIASHFLITTGIQ